MDESLIVTYVKTEPIESTSGDQLEIPTEIQVEIGKQKSDCLVQSEIYIKTEPQEDESELPIIACPSYQICLKDNITDDPVIKIKRENLLDDLMQDPLEVSNEIKDEGYAPINLEGEPRSKTEPTGKDENLLGTDKNDSHGNETNSDDKLLSRNNPDYRDRKYVCNECNKMFTKKWNLDIHLRIHTGEKPFTCDICQTSFNRKGNLDTHMLIHIAEKSYVCDVCSKVFRHKSALNAHKFIHSDKKPFCCSECNKVFAHKTSLIVHNRLHTGDKPFACSICGKIFVTNSDLTKHTRTHTGEKPYFCNVCSKSFATKAHLNRHEKIHKI